MLVAQAEQALKEGRVGDALRALQNAVRNEPARGDLRVFLFQLLCVQGAWERALNQLRVVGELEVKAFPMVQAYREAIRCESLREAVFAGHRQPMPLGEPEGWIALYFEALRHTASGRHEAAADLREQALEQVPETPGRLGEDQRFEWIVDADSRIGPFLEVFVEGGYYWVPFGRIASVEIEAPVDLRDLIWTPATFTWANGGTMMGFVPTRYAGPLDGVGNDCLMSRRTEWAEPAPETFLGTGQRMFFTQDSERALLDVRSVTFDPRPATQ
jgi:type VI secretion system protein ImpE